MDIAGSSRGRFTVSKRYRRWGEPFNTPSIEKGEEILTEPFSGGSTNITLLLSFETHIATDIWIGDV